MPFSDLLRSVFSSTQKSRRKQTTGFASFDSLEARLLLTAPSMLENEQYMLELINRARANPSAEASRYGIGLNDGLAAGTITTAAKQPLAPQQNLINVQVPILRI